MSIVIFKVANLQTFPNRAIRRFLISVNSSEFDLAGIIGTYHFAGFARASISFNNSRVVFFVTMLE